MRIAIMQPYFFPYIGYYQLIHAVDKFIIYDDINFINKGWINRNYILLNQQKHLITIPLIKSSQNKLINDIKINYNKKQWDKILNLIYHAYKKSIMFAEVFSIIEQILLTETTTISDLSIKSIEIISRYLEIDTLFMKSSLLSNNKNFTGEEKIIEICKLQNAKKYINPIGGIDLYNKEKFELNNIELYFIKTNPITYIQYGSNFIPNLSIIDVLMFNKKEQITKFIKNYNLI